YLVGAAADVHREGAEDGVGPAPLIGRVRTGEGTGGAEQPLTDLGPLGDELGERELEDRTLDARDPTGSQACPHPGARQVRDAPERVDASELLAGDRGPVRAHGSGEADQSAERPGRA